MERLRKKAWEWDNRAKVQHNLDTPIVRNVATHLY